MSITNLKQYSTECERKWAYLLFVTFEGWTFYLDYIKFVQLLSNFYIRKPDLVFKIGKKKFAIEIETGSGLRVISRMKEKLKVLNEYDEWFFVVTNRNKIKDYKKYGKVVDLRFLRGRIDKLLKK